MAPTIFTVLNPHPVNKNDNLRKIAFTIGLSPPKGHTKVQLQQAIENYVRDKPVSEQKVRDMANEIKCDNKQIKCATEPIAPPPNDHETSNQNTQLDLFVDENPTNSASTNSASANNNP